MQKTRAQLLVEKLEQPSVKVAITGKPVPKGRVVQQSESVSAEKLEKRRAALKKLQDFRDGVI